MRLIPNPISNINQIWYFILLSHRFDGLFISVAVFANNFGKTL